MSRLKFSVAIILSLVILSCGNETLPKPKAMLRLDYPEPEYSYIDTDCPFRFERNGITEIEYKKECSFNLQYPKLKANIYITYKDVGDNLDSLLKDAQKLTYEHVVKADNIIEQPFVNDENKVYGMFYDVKGNAASQTQFYLTDSVQHFLTGSLYFYAKPNYDSILPAADYIEKDIRKLMETFRWKESK